MERRDFLKLSGGALAAGAVAGTRELAGAAQIAGPFAAPAIPLVRVAYVGIGGQGSGHVRNLLRIPGCRIKCLREGTATDMDVYDAAVLSAVVPLSVQSVARKSAPVDVPDFTRGRWRTTPPLPIVHM
jgi:hypothetical protein